MYVHMHACIVHMYVLYKMMTYVYLKENNLNKNIHIIRGVSQISNIEKLQFLHPQCLIHFVKMYIPSLTFYQLPGKLDSVCGSTISKLHLKIPSQKKATQQRMDHFASDLPPLCIHYVLRIYSIYGIYVWYIGIISTFFDKPL